MGQIGTFYDRYWEDKHIKASPFDDRPGEWTVENFRYHMDFFKPFVKGRLLDFGCGSGQFLNMISRYCDSSCGIDIVRAPIEEARISYPHLEFSLLNGDGMTSFQDNSFDTVCMIDVLEHILDMESVLEEINRILKPGGHLLIATNEITRIKLLLIMLNSLDNYFYPASPHIRYFTKRNLSDLLQRKGFRCIKYKKNRTYFGFVPRGQMVIASKMDKKEFQK